MTQGQLTPPAGSQDININEFYSNAGKANKNRLFTWFKVRLSFKKSTGNLKDPNERDRRADLRKSRSTDELRKSTYALFKSKSTDKALQMQLEKAAPDASAVPAVPAIPAIKNSVPATPSALTTTS